MNLDDRLEAMERQITELELEVPLGLSRRLLAIEASHQGADRGGENIDPEILGSMPHKTESEVRRELAKEIVGGIRTRWRSDESREVIRWIDLEYSGEVAGEHGEHNERVQREVDGCKEWHLGHAAGRISAARKIAEEARMNSMRAALGPTKSFWFKVADWIELEFGGE